MNYRLGLYIPPYLSPKLEVREHLTKKGKGIFAREEIGAGEHLVTFGGEVLSYQMLCQLPKQFHPMTLQIGNELYLAPLEIHESDYVNHSCSPNVGMQNENTLVSITTIAAGQEACFDYAMTDSSPYDEFDCYCGAAECRKQVTANDWQQPDLWKRYQNYFSPYLCEQIQKLSISELSFEY